MPSLTDCGTLTVQVLGRFRVDVGNRPVPHHAWKRRAASDVVKYLTIIPGHVAHPEVLSDALWPELPPDASDNKLRKAVYAARRALEPELVHGNLSQFISSHEHAIALTNASVDVDVFEREAWSALRRGRTVEIERALALYGGTLLPHDLYADWTAARRQDLSELHRHLVLALVQHLEADGRVLPAIDLLQNLLHHDRTDEVVHRRIMELYAGSGHFVDARRQYTLLREILEIEVGTPPDDETERLRVVIECAARGGQTGNAMTRTMLQQSAETQVQLGRALMASGRYPEATEHLERATRLYGSLSDRGLRAQVIATIGQIYFMSGQALEGVKLLEAEDANDLPGRVRARLLTALSSLLWLQCDYLRQLEITQEARTLAYESGDEEVAIEATTWYGVALVALERIDEGLAILETAADRAIALGLAQIASRALNTIAAVLDEQGEYEREREYLERALVLAVQSGDLARLTFMLYRYGWNAWNLGQWDVASLYLQRAAAVSDPMPPTWPRAYVRHGLSWLYLCRGEYDLAQEWADRALSDVQRGEDRRAEWSLHGLLGILALRQHQYDRAAELLCSALEGSGLTDADRTAFLCALTVLDSERGCFSSASRRLDAARHFAETSAAVPALFEVTYTEALVRQLQGDLESAEQASARAEELARKMKHPYDEARALALRARIQAAQGLSTATQTEKRAAQLFDLLGVQQNAR